MTAGFKSGRAPFAFLLFLGAAPCHADPYLLINGGWGFFAQSDNVLELSQWARVPFLDGLYRLWGGTNAWMGISEGWYRNSGSRSHYYEFQTCLYDAKGYPIGVSFGPSFNRHSPYHLRGSLWVSAGTFVLSAGIEQDPQRDEARPFAGLSIKIPVWLGSHLWKS